MKKTQKEIPTFRILLKYYSRHWFFLTIYILSLVFKAVFSFLDAMFIARTIACIMETGDFTQAIIYAGISLALTGGIELMAIARVYFFKQLENRTKIDIQQQILRNAMEIRMSEYDKMGSGIIVTRLTADIDRVSTGFQEFSTRIVDILTKVAYLAYIFVLNIWLGLFMIGMIIVTAILYSFRVYYLHKLKPAVRNAAEKVNSKVIEVVRGVKDIKTLNCTENTLDILHKDQLAYKKKDDFEWYVGITLSHIEKIAEHVFKFGFIVLCIYFLRLEALTPLIFYTCFLYKDHIIDFASLTGELWYKMGEVAVHAERIFRISEPTTFQIDVYGNDDIDDFSGKVEFKNVVFGYDKKTVLKRTSFEILPKQTVAFVGESGCGKSTIINLIAHLYYKTSGQILFDGVPIENLSRDFIKENIAVVNQFPYIFNISIRDNFKLIRSDITDEEIYKLCKQTQILSHIKKLPLGLDSVIGENGCQFSGGQRQKLCIARTLARNVKILIFDEATSSLDNTSQNEIMKVIENLKQKMTIILIAHRLSTITYADCIYLMQKGKIIDQGTHEELFKNNEIYHELYLNAQNSTKKQ